MCTSPRLGREIRIFVADRNLLSAQMLSQVLSQDVRLKITLLSTPTQLISAGPRFDIGIISEDLGRSLDETMRVISAFSERFPNVRLILLMDTPSREAVVDAFRCGASGVFSRQQPIEDFLACVDKASHGEIWASSIEIDYLLSALRNTPVSRMIGCVDIDALTKREVEVVRYAGEGLSNREIAEKIGLSEHTVKNYLFRACAKIGVSSRVELLFYLMRQEKPNIDTTIPKPSDSSIDNEKAAQKGYVTAQFRKGLAHHYGDGETKSARYAYYWLTLARRNAQGIFRESSQILKELKKSMTPEELEKAEHSLAEENTKGAIARNTANGVTRVLPPRFTLKHPSRSSAAHHRREPVTLPH